MTKKIRSGAVRMPDRISNRDIVTAAPEDRQILEEAQLKQFEEQIRQMEEQAKKEEDERQKLKAAIEAVASTEAGVIVLRSFMRACGFNGNSVMFYRDTTKVADDRMIGAAWQRDIWTEYRKYLNPNHRVLIENEDVQSVSLKDK